jgi:flagellar motor protein MotB
MSTWCGVAAALALAAGLSACKSARKTCNPCSPATPAPVVADAGGPQASAWPPPPTIADAPVVEQPAAPQVTPDLAAARDKAALAEKARQEAENELQAERAHAAQVQHDLDMAHQKLVDMQNAQPPAGPVASQPTLPPPDDVESLLSELRSRTNAEIVREGDMVVVRLTNGFKPGSDLLKKDVQLITTLNATANALHEHDGASVAVVGHSDSDPIKVSRKKWRDNDQLSLARARRVATVLTSNGIDPDRISIDGRGAREPLVSPERSAADKARNRRVEIMIHL